MAQQNELRVFISSTFRDLQEERAHLVKNIFPEIRSLCRERGITFTEVDLRWGLTEEDVVLGQVIRTCLEEIDRCRPYFIGITGDRYGYVPELHEYYKDAELLATYPWLEDAAMDGASIIDLEFRHMVLNDPSSNDGGAVFLFRHRRDDDELRSDEERQRIDELKKRVRNAGFAEEEFDDVSELGRQVYEYLVEVINRDFAGAAPPTPLESERSRHRAFAESRRHAYIPNPSYLMALNTWLNDTSSPLVIYAESGSGKSSLVSFWCEQMRRRRPDLPIVEHYVGVGAGDSDHLGIIRHVIDEIKARFDRNEEIPSKPEDLERDFANWLGFGAGTPWMLVIDGINQLTGRALDLHWLPPVMPEGVKLIVTSTVEQTLVDLRGRGWQELGMQPLSEKEREAVVVRYLSEYSKGLSAEQVRRIASDVKCSHPLFLRTLLEELRLDSSHEELDSRIAHYLGTTGTEDLFQQVLQRMETDYSMQAVRDVMSLVWCSWQGLHETELADMTGMGRLKLSTLLGGLDYHLVRKDGVLTFFHDYLRRAVEKRYLSHQEWRLERYGQLSEYFAAGEMSVRTTLELVHALKQTGDQSGVDRVMTEIERFGPLWHADQEQVLQWWSGRSTEEITDLYGEGLRQWKEQYHADGVRQAEALSSVTSLYNLIGAWGEAEPLTLERLELLRHQGDRFGEVRTMTVLSELLLNRGRLDEAETWVRQAETLARVLGDSQLVAGAAGGRGVIHANRGEFDEALACYREQEEIAQELGDRRGIATAAGNRGIVHYNCGDFVEAMECFVERESIMRELGDRRGIAIAVGNRGNVHFVRGDFAEALACYREQESIARELGNRPLFAHALGTLGIVHSERGEYDEALACFYEAEMIARDLSDHRRLCLVVGRRAIVHAYRGEYTEALACLREQEMISRESGNRLEAVTAIGNRGLMHFDCEEYAEALEHFSRAALENREIGARPSLSHCLVGSARVLLAVAITETTMPEWLGAYVPNATADSWIDSTLITARAHAEECLKISTEISKSETLFSSQLVLARITAAEGMVAEAIDQMEQMLDEESEDQHRAELHYWLSTLAEAATAQEHRQQALALYRRLYEQVPIHEVNKRILELESEAQS
jgi:tetratricopeptide (TPR) repeat protein